MTDTQRSHAAGVGARPPGKAPPGPLRAIIESLADGILIVDRNEVIRFANPAAEALFNRSADDLIGTSLGTPLVAGETTELEIVRRGGGDVAYAELRVVETEWEGETVELISLREITDRKHAAERARQLTHEREARLAAEGASQAKSDFLAIMSHELRTPLNAILGYSEIMEMGLSGEVSETMREHIGRVHSSARHLLGLVNDILDIAKVEAGNLSVASVRAEISDAIAPAVALVEPQAAAKGLDLILTPADGDLPPYIGDDERVRQILVNLLSNAVKCTPAGGAITIAARVTTAPDASARLQPRGTVLCLSVADTGMGIAPEMLDAIFEPFVQEDSGLTRSQEGSGLGLTIAQRLARAMGGDLTVRSAVGKGSTFSLWLPAHVEGDEAHTSRSSSAEQLESDDAQQHSRDGDGGVPVEGLGEVASAILSDVDTLLATVVSRIRSDPQLIMAAGLRTSQVADHLATFLADVAGALIIVEEAEGRPSALLSDATEIQRLISERHGEQRARLGWTEAAVRREFMIIRAELERFVRKALPPGSTLRPEDAIVTINRFVDRSEYVSVRALEKDIAFDVVHNPV